MRVMVLNTDYPEFIARSYRDDPGLARRSWAEQWQVRCAFLFGVCDWYSGALRRLGHEAADVIVNHGPLQAAWAREHGLAEPGPPVPPSLLARLVRRLRRRDGQDPIAPALQDVLAAQIAAFAPDVLIVLAMTEIPTAFLRRLQPRPRIIVGQHAALPLPRDDWAVYDLVVSSFGPTVDDLRRRGLRCELLDLACEPSVQDAIGERSRDIPVSFIGSLAHPVYAPRRAMLEAVCRAIPATRVFTPHPEHLGPAARACWAGDAFGRAMYEVLGRSRITLNHHGEVGPWANNLRLYEACLMGAALVTDDRPHLAEILAPGSECLAVGTAGDYAAACTALLADPARLGALACAGRERVLRDHTWDARLRRLCALTGALA